MGGGILLGAFPLIDVIGAPMTDHYDSPHTSGRLRILHVISSVNPAFGGPIEGILRQSEATRTSAAREIVTVDPPSAPYLSTRGVRVHATGVEKNMPFFSRILNHYGYTPHLLPWLRRNAGNYDAIVVHGLWNFATLGASLVLPNSRTPYFVFPHGMMDPWFKTTYPLKHLAKKLFWLFCEGRLLSGAKLVFFTTEEEMKLASGQFPLWTYTGKVSGYGTTAPPPRTKAQDEALSASLPALRNRRYLLFLSRIHRKKGCDLLIEAFAKIAHEDPGLDLVVAGPDQEGLVALLQERAEALGVGGRVHWPGMTRDDLKWGAYYNAEAFVLPSHQENFGIVVAEALGCGTPVLISDKVNIWREVEAGGAGLVRPDDATGTESLLRDWLALAPSQRVSMRQAARRTFEQSFDLAGVAPAIVETIKGSL